MELYAFEDAHVFWCVHTSMCVFLLKKIKRQEAMGDQICWAVLFFSLSYFLRLQLENTADIINPGAPTSPEPLGKSPCSGCLPSLDDLHLYGAHRAQ